MRRAAAVLLLLAPALGLAACGSKGPLTPAANRQLPVAPYGEEVRPTSEKLLAAPPQAQPDRNVELRKRSEERADDPFDLPPPE